MECISECQTFPWGGTGTPKLDGVGSCSCVCGAEEGWCDFNILGQASCVPVPAHVVFGALGLASSVAGLLHAAYQLHRQVEYHAHQITASSSPIEECRRSLHGVAIVHAGLSLVYFAMLLVLEGHQLWGSTILLAGVLQLTASIGGVLTTRMWIYTNDPRLMQETPEILAISNMLERPAGQYTSCGIVCVGGTIATILAAAKHAQAAIIVATVAFICLCVACNVIIRKCGTALVRTIDGSLQNASENHPTTTVGSPEPAAKGAGHRKDNNDSTTSKKGGESNLLAARKKITMAMSICLSMASQTVAMLLFAIFSRGTAPLYWFIFNIQLHAGRSKPRAQRSALSSASGTSQRTPKFGQNLLAAVSSPGSRRNQVIVPTQTPASP